MTAILIEENRHGVQIRLARSSADCWPHWDVPLGRVGYWVGTHENHVHVESEREAFARIRD